MSKQVLYGLGEELQDVGYALTSFEQLGIAQFEELARDLRQTIVTNSQLQPVRAAERTGMVMCKDDASKQAGARLVKPVVEVLFVEGKETAPSWVPYTVNHYETGHYFNPHQDYLDGTVMIATALGTREIDIYRKEDEDDVFNQIERTYSLSMGTILLLNGYKDFGHGARCVEGPSIAVVGDISASVPTAG
ncbi:hypothetical protein A3E76_06310 [Candidatus Saccharibacteria bacterium RIFCSPHIGHO2_12_FULL_44_22]|nr:MAG: hypothetical protein A3E76_06310 [Candidatus Saccharibacteria bacterium RIFCSPHIGHO2_12_FULL_44_22]